jgi:lycopene beta-cyclase
VEYNPVTYFSILLIFLVPPIISLLVLLYSDTLLNKSKKLLTVDQNAYLVLLAHILLALLYTTPWDNYLIANRVWWYEPNLIKGIIIGWVPIEEYLFFILQTILTGFWFLFVQKYLSNFFLQKYSPNNKLYLFSFALVLFFWFLSLLSLALPNDSTRYLSLILSWAIFPIIIQIAWGMDILISKAGTILIGILPPTLYLWFVDRIALSHGIWIINPNKITGLNISGLPIEEMLFFLCTNMIIVFGMTLMLSPYSQGRITHIHRKIIDYFLKNIHHILLFFRRNPHLSKIWGLALLIWLIVLITTPILMWFLGKEVFIYTTIVSVASHSIATLIAVRLKWSNSRIFLAILFISLFTWGAEFLGISTGFPFGNYHYTTLLQPQIASVPILIPFAWLMMLFPSWAIADSIISSYLNRSSLYYRFVFSFFSGMIFTAWDLYLDPQMVAQNLWVWDQKGYYFGIPLSNFFGWWLTASLLAFIIRPFPITSKPLMTIYTLTWFLQFVALGFFWEQPGPAVFGFFGMGIFVIWGWYLEYKRCNMSTGQQSDFSLAQSHSP